MMFDAHANLVRSGHFVMASGHHGDRWLDLELLFNDPATLQPMIVALGRRLARYTPDTVCGPLSGGALLAYAIAQRFGWQFVFTEPHASSFAVPAALIPRLAGRRIAIVDDAINAGSALEATYADLCRHGATCVGIGTLFALGSAPAKAAAAMRLPMETLSRIPNNLWMPDECPLCRSGVLLDA